MAEMRQSLEQERERLVADVKKQMEVEKQQAVDETKKKQWCANCRKEAIFYCCWNTSYCDYPCQQAHWPEHMKSCTQSGIHPQAGIHTNTKNSHARIHCEVELYFLASVFLFYSCIVFLYPNSHSNSTGARTRVDLRPVNQTVRSFPQHSAPPHRAHSH